MRILLSNDDGYQAPGLMCLERLLSEFAEVTVVAPDRNRSGASNSLTLDRPLRVSVSEKGYYYVNGTPTDCVHLAITGLLKVQPDMVIAGINAGANLGDDVLYSGTVAAAMEGRFMGLPAIAFSLAGRRCVHYETAAKVAVQLIKEISEETLPVDTIYNVNIPDVEESELNGWVVTRLGHRHKAEPTVKAQDPRGQAVYWVGPAGPEQDAGEGTDFFAIRNKQVAITPILTDLTRHDRLAVTKTWIERLQQK
ncbi:5'-nucleotidase SurE [hydrothermal vent metagenome]|uniref:5'-nucleotidase n=1 Tax=hydrothermal vent metagenome TaxID=652676 RepID=A0A3B0ZLN8_9ZZZZ